MSEKTETCMEVARTNVRLAVAWRRTNFAETARKAGLSRNALSQFVGGKTSISYANMLAICDVLDIPIGALHTPDAITESKMKLYRLLRNMPDNLASQALELARAAQAGEAVDGDGDGGKTTKAGALRTINSTI
jgi:transcriptional regulator with XRE-family HTH domain